MHATDYKSTFIEIAEDCPVRTGVEPPVKRKKSVARLQYEFLASAPYTHTSDELLLSVHMITGGIPEVQREAEREKLFSKGQACMRSSDLGKRYGWGVHFDGAGRMALYAADSPEYALFRADSALAHKRAMRSSKKEAQG